MNFIPTVTRATRCRNTPVKQKQTHADKSNILTFASKQKVDESTSCIFNVSEHQRPSDLSACDS